MYLLRGTDEAGEPVELRVELCWRCGSLVAVSLVSMFEHVDRMHPVQTSRHALREDAPHPPP